MNHEIKIYGEVVPFQGKHIGDKGYTNLDIVDEQLKKAEGKDILVKIHTLGGDVDEGFAIYASLRRYAKENNAKITTRADGQVASIGTVIFLAGDERIGSPYVQPFFHKAQASIKGDDQKIKKVLAGNEEANKRISMHYSKHTNLTQEEAIQLMSGETFLSPEDAEGLKFSTSTEEIQRPKALLKKNNNYNMTNKNKQSTWNKLMKDAEAFFKGSNQVNKIVFTADNRELDFYELGENDTPKVGDKALINGKPAGEDKEGKYVTPDGDTYIFEGDSLVEIKNFEDENESEKEELKNQNEELQTANLKLLEDINILKSENKKATENLSRASNLLSKINALNIAPESNINSIHDNSDSVYSEEDQLNEFNKRFLKSTNNLNSVKTSDLFQNIK